MDQQWPFCTQCIIGGLEQLHSTQNFSVLIFSPTFRTSEPNLHVICVSSTVFCCIAVSTGMISSFGSAKMKKEEKKRSCWMSNTDGYGSQKISIFKILTTPPINWATIEFSIFFPIINGNTAGHQTVCGIDFNVTFDFLTIWTIDNGCIVEIFITNTCIASNLIGKHFLSFNIFLIFQIAFGACQFFDFISI